MTADLPTPLLDQPTAVKTAAAIMIIGCPCWFDLLHSPRNTENTLVWLALPLSECEAPRTWRAKMRTSMPDSCRRPTLSQPVPSTVRHRRAHHTAFAFPFSCSSVCSRLHRRSQTAAGSCNCGQQQCQTAHECIWRASFWIKTGCSRHSDRKACQHAAGYGVLDGCDGDAAAAHLDFLHAADGFAVSMSHSGHASSDSSCARPEPGGK